MDGARTPPSRPPQKGGMDSLLCIRHYFRWKSRATLVHDFHVYRSALDLHTSACNPSSLLLVEKLQASYLHHFFRSQWDNNVYFSCLLWGLNEIIHWKHLAQCPAFKLSINAYLLICRWFQIPSPAFSPKRRSKFLTAFKTLHLNIFMVSKI